jgi:hypothetical protein
MRDGLLNIPKSHPGLLAKNLIEEAIIYCLHISRKNHRYSWDLNFLNFLKIM